MNFPTFMVLFFMGCGGVIVGIFGITYAIDTVPVTCRVDGKIVYKGRSACINVSSSGASTTVAIGRGLFCMLPGAYYVSTNVELSGDKR